MATSSLAAEYVYAEERVQHQKEKKRGVRIKLAPRHQHSAGQFLAKTK